MVWLAFVASDSLSRCFYPDSSFGVDLALCEVMCVCVSVFVCAVVSVCAGNLRACVRPVFLVGGGDVSIFIVVAVEEYLHTLHIGNKQQQHQ